MKDNRSIYKAKLAAGMRNATVRRPEYNKHLIVFMSLIPVTIQFAFMPTISKHFWIHILKTSICPGCLLLTLIMTIISLCKQTGGGKNNIFFQNHEGHVRIVTHVAPYL